jgi:MATE family multidrug resistance protein
LQASFTTFVFLGARYGDVTLAANQVLLQFLEITAFGLDGFAFAAESLVGQAVGARSALSVRRASVVASQWGVGGSVALGLAFWFAGPPLIDLMTTEPDVRSAARSFLPWVAIAPVIGIASWMFDGIFIGATLSREMRNTMLASVVVYVVALLTLPPVLGNHGLWAALMVLNVARGTTMALFYRRAETAAAG